MSCEIWNIEKDLCRCCHSEGTHKNLSESKSDDKLYLEMLKDCFDISLSPVPGLLCVPTYTICEACILRLQDATNFKQQVLYCEEKFNDMYSKNLIKVAGDEPEVKVELDDSFVDGFKEDYSPDDDDGFVLKYDEEDDNNSDLDVEESKKSKSKKAKTKPKSKSGKTKKGKKVGRPRKLKEESAEEGETNTEGETEKKIKSGNAAPKFRLMEEDYTRDGDTFQCSRCDKRYDKIFSLRYHVKTVHYKIPKFYCQYCMKNFMTLAPLTVHKLEEHNIDERFKCKACKGMFNTKVQLRKHINNFHMLGEKYKCEFCEYESFSFEGMYKHKFKHKTVKDHHCKFCRKSFLRKTTLDLHERIHTGDRRKVCKVCGQAFVQKASLNYHMTKYHPEVNF